MKKAFYIIAALTGLALLSCNKEKETPVVPAPEKGLTHTVSIKATIAPETRTSYLDDKTFTWKAQDSILVFTLSPDGEDLSVSTFYAESDGPTTVFSGEVEEGYSLYDMAFYTAAGSYITIGEDAEGESRIYVNLPTATYVDGDSERYYTVESTNPLANLPLFGVKQEGEEDTYLFYTACGAAKFTFTDIPEGATYFVVERSTEALSGHFTWNEDGVLANDTYRPGTYSYEDEDGETVTMSYSSHYVIYHFERNEDGTGTFYMPLPVGKIPVGSTVSFYNDGFEDELFVRTIRADVPIERNRVTEVTPLSATSGEWESMGYGYYYDLLPFYFMNSEVSLFANVEFFKNDAQPGIYRIQNPYPVAAEAREYTVDESVEFPEYLEFTIMKNGLVYYDDLHTGYRDSDAEEGDGDWFAGCPAYWGEDNSFNFVAKYQEDGTPELVVLSPLYLYTHDNGYYYAYTSTTWRDMFGTIYFPGADVENSQYDLSCTVSLTEIADDAPELATGVVSVDLGEHFAGARLVIASSAAQAEELLAAGKGLEVSESGEEYLVEFPENAPSGTYFAYAKTIPAEGFTDCCALLFESEDEFEYYRSDEDRQLTLDDIIGDYTGKNYYRTTNWTREPKTLTLSVDEGDPLSGYEIMFTDICPEIANALGSMAQSITAHPVDARFNTKTGVVTIPAGQKAYTIQFTKSKKTDYTIGDVYGKDVVLFLSEPGVLVNKHNIGLWTGGELAGNTNANTTFTRGTTASAPARSFGRHSLRPFHFQKEEQPVSYYPGFYKERGVRVPFTGAKTKAQL